MTINLFETRTMLKFAERLAPVSTFLKDTFFKEVETSDTKKVDVDIKKGSVKVAPFVSEIIGGKVIENSGYETKTFEPPLVAPFKITTAGDLQKRLMGEGVYSSSTPDERAAKKLLSDLNELEGMVTLREEVMCAQAIFDGKVTVKGEGVDYEIDFNHTNRQTLSGADLWSANTSKKLADFKRWVRTVQRTGFVNTDYVVISPEVTDVLMNDEEILKLLDLRNVNIGEFKPQLVAPGVTYIGKLAGIGDIYEYSAQYYDEISETVKPIVPAGSLALLSSQAMSSMAYAAVTIAEGENLVTVEGTRVPETWTEKKPARQFVALSAKPLPVPKEINSWYVAKVL